MLLVAHRVIYEVYGFDCFARGRTTKESLPYERSKNLGIEAKFYAVQAIVDYAGGTEDT